MRRVNTFYSCLMTPEFGNSPGPALVVRTPDAEPFLSAGRSYYIGRDPQADIVVNDSRVSWRHAVLRLDGSTWLLEDAGSTNGIFEVSNRIQRLPIASTCAVRLGHPNDGPAMSSPVSAPVQARPEPIRPGGVQPTAYAPTPNGPPPANPAVGRGRPGPRRQGGGG